jgi:hypothetical protein
MAATEASPVSEPRLRMAIAHADDDTNLFLDRLYGGDDHRGPRNSMTVPWTQNQARVNPLDVLATFLYAAHMGHERNVRATSGS